MTLVCPICQLPLKRSEHSAVCENRHCFDYAKSGYLNLAINEKSNDHGDNPAMVKARISFLESGCYLPLKDALQKVSESFQPETALDLGCGEGWYTRGLSGKDKYGIDLSRDALKHAAKTDPDTQYILSSIFHLPFSGESADLIVTCFAPAATDEILRVLKSGGHFIYVTPGPHHLYELKQVLYETPYLNQEKELISDLKKIDTVLVTAKFEVNNEQLMNLFEMTPYAYHTGIEGIEKLRHLNCLSLSEEFTITVFEK